MVSGPRRISSELMKEGANVFDVGVPVFEFDRCLVVVVWLGGMMPASDEYDWCRL